VLRSVRPCRSRRQKQEHRVGIKQRRNDKNKPAQNVLIAGAEQRCEISDRAQVGTDLCPLAINASLLDLQAGERPGLADALGHELGACLALIFRQRHQGSRSALAGRLLDRGVNLADAPVDIGQDASLHRDPRIHLGVAAGDCDIAGDRVSDVRSMSISSS